MTAFAPVVGRPHVLADDLALVLAPNPSPMTDLGTNTYLLGRDRLAVIDPGPQSDAHFQALFAAIGAREVTHILVTHSHLDHSPLAKRLSAQTGAPVYAFGPSDAGRSNVMQTLAQTGMTGGGEGIDRIFSPDIRLTDGAQIKGDWGEITAIHTPGHMGNHMCFRWGEALFSGDHVMGWASSLVSPPDGDLTDFMASCEKLQRDGAKIYYPGHGSPVASPARRLAWLISHRKARETQILQYLVQGPATPGALAGAIYIDTPAALRAAATRNVFAHLVDLHQRRLVTCVQPLGADAVFAIAEG